MPSTVNIYYGSEMGTGEGFAEELGEYLTKEGINNVVMDIDDFEEEDIVKQDLCIFFFSTYGNGVPTRYSGFGDLFLGSSRAFFAWMKSNCKDSSLLKNMRYIMFGLGDHNYPHFNAASIVFFVH